MGSLLEEDVAVGRGLFMLLGVLERSRSCECCERSSDTSSAGGDGLDSLGVTGVDECREWSSDTSTAGGDGLGRCGIAGVAGVGVSLGAG